MGRNHLICQADNFIHMYYVLNIMERLFQVEPSLMGLAPGV